MKFEIRLACIAIGLVITAPSWASLSLGGNIGTSDHGVFFVGSQVGTTIGQSSYLGVEITGGQAKDFHVNGFKESSAGRYRLRLPFAYGIGNSGRATLGWIHTTGVRLMESDTRSSTALTYDTGVAMNLALTKTWDLNLAFYLPFAFDVNGAGELSRFPGIVNGLGVNYHLAKHVSLYGRGFISIPEGYNGDTVKSAFELKLGMVYRFSSTGDPKINQLILPESI